MQIRSSNFRFKVVKLTHAPTFQTFQFFQTPPEAQLIAKQGELYLLETTDATFQKH